MEKEELRAHLTTRDTWIRGLYMLLFAVIYSIAEIILVAVVIFQFLARLITGAVNQRLLEFGQQLSRYLYDMLRFFTFNSDEKPYPFAPWNKHGESGRPAPGTASTPRTAKPAVKKNATKKKAAARKRAVTKRRAPAKPAAEKSTEKTQDGPANEPPADETPPG